ncbi:La domain family protein protein [Grosmannia clavigera kw1407]|uniref:La domain family protein protein n=1 Tax=Grosmannia clavigera (strain kw1407 / UAMH 11150) TaxID=655863 RepID=F0XC76_GROCL|nr:La domain family protein [Grosmannia clavigera kw1407]EFX04742.1 La domain family protein protein [Grosmannia clavigera kw1407]
MSATGFSYAQAARGQAAPQVTTPVTSSVAPPRASPEENDVSNPTTIPEAGTALVLSVTSDASKLASSESGYGSRKVDSDAGSATDSATLIGTLVESTSNISLDDVSFHASASYKNGYASAIATRSSSSDDSARKSRKGKTTKTSTKDADLLSVDDAEKDAEAPKVVLSPAPVPIKNIWDERRRELAAKAKQPPASKPDSLVVATGATGANGGLVKSQELKKGSAPPTDLENHSETFGATATFKPHQRRLSETSRGDQTRRNGSRVSKVVDKDAKNLSGRSILPFVQDTTLWPTPESAAVTEDAKAKSLAEKVDRLDDGDKDTQEEGALAKSRKKGAWVALDFVPTVNFQTPLPNVRGSKPKAGSRGGRDSSSRGGYNSIANGSAPSEKAVSMPTPMDKTPDFRDKAKEANGTAITARPHFHASNPAKRFSIDSTHNREIRKSSAAADHDRTKNAVSNYSGLPVRADFVPKGTYGGGVNGDTDNHHHIALPVQSDRRFATAKATDHHASSSKENGTLQLKEPGLTARERTEARGERTGRGGFRGGRGGHASSASQGHHFSRSGYQQNGQRAASNGAVYGSNGSLPPSAVPFNPTAQQYSFGHASNVSRSSKTPGRAQSVSQVPTFSNRLQNGVASIARSHNHAAQMAGVPAEFHMQQPYPFATYSSMEIEHLQPLVKQLEYYFSLENLCKDMFLRRKMDGQGFVRLAIVASFRRMAELAPTLDYVRAACEQSEKLDYILDKDQTELVRSRTEWRKFILPEEQRMEEVRGPGPDLRSVHFRSLHSRPPPPFYPAALVAGYPTTNPAIFQASAFAPNGSEPMYQPYDNGMSVEHTLTSNGNTQVNGGPPSGESQLSAKVPVFSPSGGSGAPTTLEDYQNCPDEQVENSQDNMLSNGHDYSLETSLETLIEGSRSATVISSAPLSLPATDAVGGEPYPGLRTKAFDQRKNSKSGETPAAMKHLYQFWSHCLPDKFNVRMYEDFRSSALEDARGDMPCDFGLRCLLRYYNHVLTDAGPKPYPSVFVPHFTEARELVGSWKAASGEA